MLVGSQVSLKYDLDLSLTQVPENLIFYSDEEMTKAFLKENGAIHLDGTFLANDDNKTANRTIYWQWPIETGLTQTEIDNNDGLDSKWIGSDVILGIAATGKQIMGDPDEKYTVTLDLNGGTLANHGEATMLTKQVNYGEAYGDLPVPTREGYRFVGWNGKNLFDENSILMAINGAKYENEHYVFSTGQAYKAYGGITESSYLGNKQMNINYKENTQYTLVIKGSSQYIEDKARYCNLYYGFFYTDGTKSSIGVVVGEGTYLKTSDPNKTVECISFSFGIGGNAYIESIQLEEGTAATPYEPYYITSSTPVSQNKNHTLTAIWEPISNP